MAARVYAAREGVTGAACVVVTTAIGQTLTIDLSAFLLILSLSWTACATCREVICAQQQKRKEWQEARRKWVLENTMRPVEMCDNGPSHVAAGA